jgi:hypothetical protein
MAKNLLDELTPTTEITESDWLKVFDSDELPPIEVGYGDAKISFTFRVITDEEEESVLKRVRELEDLDEETRRQRLFPLYTEALGRFLTKPPTLHLNDKATTLEGTPVEAMQRLFANYNAKTWKVISRAFVNLRALNEPNVNFR